MSTIIKDYGKTVSPEVYINALQGHQYIPQADQVIFNVVNKHCKDKAIHREILDLGCGPGRLTFNVAYTNCHVTGLDISENFIEYARYQQRWESSACCPGTTSFQCNDFTKNGVLFANEKYDNTFDVILMQGVMHHIHGEDRVKFLQKSFDLLKPDGILTVGDEFIKDYKTEEERILNVAKFYLHIIDEARKGGFNDLAEEEAKNLVDDCFSDTEYAGYITEKAFEYICEYARMINTIFYQQGSAELNSFSVNNHIREMFDCIELCLRDLVDSSKENFNRGDYKVSIDVFVDEVLRYGFVLKEKYEIGPVKQLGGMGVLVFRKNP